MLFLLDTNIVSDPVHRPQGRAAARIARVEEDRVCPSVIVAAELRHGAAKKASLPLSGRVEAALGVVEVVSLEVPADAIYGEVRARLERRGQLTGANDPLIAAQALTLGPCRRRRSAARYANRWCPG